MKSYNHNPPREEKEEMKNVNTNLSGITVKFPGSNKTYDYIIADDGWLDVTIGDKIRIINEHFYNYSKSEVEVVNCTNIPTQNATMRIIAFTDEYDHFGWLDIDWIETVKHKQSEYDLVTCFDSINTRREYYSFDEYFENSRDFRALFKKTPSYLATSDSYSKTQLNKIGLDGTWVGTSMGDEIGYYNHRIETPSNECNKSFENTAKSITIATDSLNGLVITANEAVKNYNNDIIKGEDNMNIFSNFDFGKVTKDDYAMTLKGIAYRSLGNSSAETGHSREYVQYNTETNDFEDVTPFVLDINVKDFLFKMPVATSAVKAGDIILDRQSPVFVKEVKGSEIIVVDPITREVRTILATKNIFNFNFVTKIVNLMDNFNLSGSASAENPFGNILPLMMLSDNKNMKDILPLMLLGNGSVDFASNPMMLYFLMKDGKSNDMLPFLLMSNPNLFGAQNTSASGDA